MYPIIWTQLAKDTYAALLDYLMQFSLDAAIDLDEKIDKLTDRLAQFRDLCPRSPKVPTQRRCVVTKNASLIYEVRKNSIYILAVIDNRAANLYV